jgi:hypothetical protein
MITTPYTSGLTKGITTGLLSGVGLLPNRGFLDQGWSTSVPSVEGLIVDNNSSNTTRPLQPHRCFRLSGTDEHVNPNIYSSDLSDSNLSISLWLSPDTVAGSQFSSRVFSIFRFSTQSALMLSADDNALNLYCNDGTAETLTTPAVADTWYHVVAVVESDSTVSFWVNGIKIGQTTGSIEIQSVQREMLIGCGAEATNCYDGKIFDFRIYEQALTETQVLDLYQNKTEGLLTVDSFLHYKFDDQEETAVYDSSGNSRHGLKVDIASYAAAHYEGADVPFSWENDAGYSVADVVGNIPRDESTPTKSAIGGRTRPLPLIMDRSQVILQDPTQSAVSADVAVTEGKRYAIGIAMRAADVGDDIRFTCNGEEQILDPGAANLANRSSAYFENGVVWEANTTGTVTISAEAVVPADVDIYGFIIREQDDTSGCVEDQGTSLFCGEYCCEYNGDIYALHSEMYTGTTYLSKNFLPVGKVFDRIVGDYNEKWHNGNVVYATANGVYCAQVGHNQNEVNTCFLPGGDLAQATDIYTISGSSGQFSYCFMRQLSDGRMAMLVRGTPFQAGNFVVTMFIVSDIETDTPSHTSDVVFNDPNGRVYTRSMELYTDGSGNDVICCLWNTGSSARYANVQAALFAPGQGSFGKWYNIRGEEATVNNALGTSAAPRFNAALTIDGTDTGVGIELLETNDPGQRFVPGHTVFWRVTQYPVGVTAPTADTSFIFIDASARLQYVPQTIRWCQYVAGVRTLDAATPGISSNSFLLEGKARAKIGGGYQFIIQSRGERVRTNYFGEEIETYYDWGSTTIRYFDVNDPFDTSGLEFTLTRRQVLRQDYCAMMLMQPQNASSDYLLYHPKLNELHQTHGQSQMAVLEGTPPTPDILAIPDLQYTGKAPSNIQAVQANCGDFNGTDAWVDVPFGMENATSYELRARFKTSTPTHAILDNRDENDDGIILWVNTSGRVAIYHNAVDLTSANVGYADDEWHEVVAAWDGTTLTLTVDGTDAVSTAAGTAMAATTNFAIGRVGYGDSLHFDGQICDVEITVNGTVQGRYAFSEGTGGTVYDLTDNGNHASGTNLAWTTQDIFHWNLSKGFSTPSTYTFNGISDSVELTAVGATSNLSSRTFGCNFVLASGAGDDVLISTRGPESSSGWTLRLSKTNRSVTYFHAGSTVLTSSNNVFDLLTDHRIVLTKTGTSVVVTIDGTEVINATVNAGTNSDTPPHLGVTPRDPAQNWFEGTMSNLTYTEDGTNYDSIFTAGLLKVPARTSTLLDAQGNEIQYPAGAFHNNAESKLDFTGGVARQLHAFTRANIVTQPEDFESTWVLVDAVATNDAITAPDGTTTAGSVVENSDNGNHSIQFNFTPVSGNTYTGSLYIKDIDRRYVALWFGGTSFNSGVTLDLSTGIATEITGFNALDSFSVSSVGDGWYRLVITDTATAGVLTNFKIYLLEDGDFANRTYVGDGSSGVYLWGAKVEQGSVATNYHPVNFVDNYLTAWSAFDAMANSHFFRQITSGGSNSKADRFVKYSQPVLGTRLQSVQTFTTEVAE